MEKRFFEKLGIEASLLGYGCMRFPTADDKIDEKQAQQLIDRALEHGVTYIDTAYPYHNGESELFVKKALKKYSRDSYLLADKLPLWEIKTIQDAERIFEEQLKKTGVDYFDFYLLHAMDEEKWNKTLELGILEFCDNLKAQGKIRSFGFSFHDEYEVFEKIITYRDWDFVQLQLNYIDIREQAGLRGCKLAEKLGVPIIVMEPVKGGTLASLPEEVDALFKQHIPNASTASWAMRWCGSLSNVKVILSGMSDMAQVEDNLKTFSNFKPLDDEEKAIVDRVAQTLNSRMKNPCTDCRYCLPCPAGVNIPANFAVWNNHAVYGNTARAAERWKNFKADEKAFNCIECGKCETKCPQKINIRSDLKCLQKEMDSLK